MSKGPFSQDVTRITLAVLFIALLIAACLWIMQPFLSAIIWATMIVIATWPLMLSIQARLGGKRGLAVLVMTLLLLAILIVPLTFAITTVIEKAQEIIADRTALAAFKIPAPPAWLEKIPAYGVKASAKWQELAILSSAELSERLSPYTQKVVGWFLIQAGSIGMMLLHCFLTVILSAVLYVHGETAANGVKLFFRRLAGPQGEDAAILAAKAVRGVAIGIVGTAMIQSFLGGIGLIVAGIPAAAVLTALMLLLCVAQVGPALILVPATIWLFMQGQTSWGVFMAVCTLIVCTIDNVIRPFLIKKGADLPLLLIFAGVIGGLISFGLIGLFIGPVMLAVTYTLVKEWVTSGGNGQKEVIAGE